ncbi:homoserine dehydrogenase [Aureococcus anophagefferens]|nr:homoserine dehydrogenase [Aureococcus anophagefferens]
MAAVDRGQPFEKLDYNEKSPILVCTGFVATSKDGVPTTPSGPVRLFRDDLRQIARARRVTMWKNTNGVYTADPRRVPEAFPIESLKYDEAMELAYFGAQVLHPSAMLPCIDDNIPVYVRNIFNPSFEGTVIEGRSDTLAASWGKVEDDEDAAPSRASRPSTTRRC